MSCDNCDCKPVEFREPATVGELWTYMLKPIVFGALAMMDAFIASNTHSGYLLAFALAAGPYFVIRFLDAYGARYDYLDE